MALEDPTTSGVDELCFLSATEMIARFRAGTLSPVEVTNALLDRIERVNPAVNAFCTIAADTAIEDARRAESAILSGDEVGPLEGVPVAFKDVTETAGIRTTYGSPIFLDHFPDEDAIVVERARRAGCVLLGKTNTPEFACKGTTSNSIFGPTRNPWDPRKTAGGSSGGSAAAVSAGLIPLAEGNDLAGSVRIPASVCGVVGFRPSLGRVPTYPTPNAWTTFLTHGPLARTVADASLFYSVMAGPDPRDPQSIPCTEPITLASQKVSGLRAAWSATLGYAPVCPQVRAIAEEAASSLQECGIQVDSADPGFNDPRDLFIALSAPWRAGVCGGLIPQWEHQMDPVLVERIRRTDAMSARAYETAQQERTRLSICVAKFFERFDVLLTPTTAVPAFPVEQEFPSSIDGQAISSQLEWYPHTFPFSMTGQPAISVPAGWTDDGLPVGIQIIGRRFDDERVLQVAAALEMARPWDMRRPHISHNRAARCPHKGEA